MRHAQTILPVCVCVCVSVCVCVCILFDLFSSGHDGGCFLLQTPLRCSSIAAPQGSLTGRQRASRAPHPPSRQRLARLKGPSTRPPFIGLNGPALFIFTLRHTGGPQSHNATVALSGNSVFMCVCVCVCVRVRVCVCARVFVLFNRRACCRCVVCA